MLEAAPPRYPAPEWSRAGSEEKKMSIIVLSHKAVKLMTLCDLEGFDSLEDLLQAAAADSVCPAICMTEGCDHTAEVEPDQNQGFCEACGGKTVTSVLVLAGLI
jgi:formate dehydrogenase maturation protein FdhE